MSSSTYPIATISNPLPFDVDIYDTYNPNSSTTGPLQYTLLATVTSGSQNQSVQTIHVASSLQAMRTGNVTALNNNYYEQFPVAVLAVTILNDSNSFTLTNDMQQGMEQSFNFIKYTSANSSSQLAVNFRTALSNTTDQASAVNAFFAATTSFNMCTLSTWIAVFTWEAQFISPWQGTFYLYNVTSGANPPPIYLVATLAITASASGDSAVVTMAQSSGENAQVVMAGDGTMQESNPGSGPLSVSLTPVWLNIAQTSTASGKPVTTYAIGAAYTGTINGIQVAGNLTQLTIPDAGDKSKSACDKNSANQFTIASFSQLASLVIGIGMLYFMAKGHKQAENQRENDVQENAPNRDQAQAAVDQQQQQYQAEDVPIVAEQAGAVQQDVGQVNNANDQVGQAADIQRGTDLVANEAQVLDNVLQEGPGSAATDAAAGNIVSARTNYENALDPNASSSSRAADISAAETTLSTTGTDLEAALQSEGNQVRQDEKNAQEEVEHAISEDEEVDDAASEAENEKEEEDENNADGNVSDDEFDNPGEFEEAVGPSAIRGFAAVQRAVKV